LEKYKFCNALLINQNSDLRRLVEYLIYSLEIKNTFKDVCEVEDFILVFFRISLSEKVSVFLSLPSVLDRFWAESLFDVDKALLHEFCSRFEVT
jgi:hypothetical protein